LFEYWDGKSWAATPAGWTYKNETVLTLSFWKKGGKWICREDEKLEWPGGVADWKPAEYEGPGNPVESKLGEWKKQIEGLWTDTFDLKRVGCASTRPECCRYKTRAVVSFREVEEAKRGVLVVGNSMFRSNATLWSLGDTDANLAPHEFGHLIGNPDEYEGASRTQTGVKDDDGLVNGIDGNSIMGPNKAIVKRRHLKGVIQAMEWIAAEAYGRKYKYEAVPVGASLALAPGTARGKDLGQSPMSAEPEEKNRLLGAAVGGVIGGLAGALAGMGAGYAMGKKDSNLAVGAGAAGAAIGAALGYFL
jgi:hypothetical protein